MKQKLKHLILLIILVAADQGTKLWVRQTLMNNDPFVILPDVFSFQYHENTGAVWGIMSGKVQFLSIFTFFILLFIVFLYLKIPQDKKYNPMKLISVFIMAGAMGNLIDRIFLGYVVDFIYFELINFPLFNVADSYIVVSCILLFLFAIFYYKESDFEFVDRLIPIKKKQTSKDLTTSEDTNKKE